MGTRTRSGDRVATEEIGSAKGLYLWVVSRTTSRVDPPSRKTAALAAALVLCLVALVFAAGEARAAEQPSHAAQQGTVESTTIINGKVAEPVPGATTPVAPPPVERPPAEAPTPPPPPKHETPPAGEEPSPPPLEPAPSTPEPDAPPPTPQPAPQWFEVVVTYGEVVESDPVLTTSRSVTDFGQMLEPETIADTSTYAGDPAPARAVAPAAVDDDGYASGPASDSALSIPGPAPAAVPPRGRITLRCQRLPMARPPKASSLRGRPAPSPLR